MQLYKSLKLKEIDAAYFLCISGLLIFFISDGCNKLLFYFQFDFYRVSILFRSIYEVFFFLLIILFINEVRLLFLKIFMLAFLLFLTGQIIFSLRMNYEYSFRENIFQFNKDFFVFIIYFAIYRTLEFPGKFQNIIKLLENIFLINSVMILLGFIFNLDFLRTYRQYRYGFDGLIPSQNEATFFYFIAISYFYYRNFILKNKSKKFFFVLLSSFFLGTKGIYIYHLMLLVFHFSYHSSLKTKLISLVIALLLIFGFSWYLQTENAKILLSYFFSKSREVGWLDTILSGRNNLISLVGADIWNHWNIINLFVGGQDQNMAILEMDFFDLFFFLGILGSAIFIGLYFSTIFKFNILKPFNFFFWSSFVIIAFFAGHFLSSAINSLYLCLTSLYFYQTQRPQSI